MNKEDAVRGVNGQVVEEPKTPIVPIAPVQTVSKKTVWFLVSIIVLLGISLTYFSYLFLGNNKEVVKNNPVENKVTSVETSVSEGIAEDPMKDWDTYTSEEYGFEFRYPKDYFVEETSGGSQELVKVRNYNLFDKDSVKPETTELYPNLLSITFGLYEQNMSAGENLENWLKANGEYVSDMSGAPTSAKSILVNGNQGLELTYTGTGKFYVFTNYKKVFYAYFNPNNSEHTDVVWQILSTLKFVSVDAKISGQTDLIVSRPKSDAQEVSTKATKYTFFYTPSFVKSVKTTTDLYYSVDFTLSSGANLSISIPFMGEATVFDKKPTLKIIDNSNFKNKIYRIKDIDLKNTYRYVTGYSEDMDDCGFVDDNSYFACDDGDALLGEGENGGAFSISCIASSAASLKGCDDFITDLNISLSDIDL